MISKEQAADHLAEGLKKLNIHSPSSATIEQLWVYFTELLKWNAKVNLVAKSPEPDILENHFLDSYTAVPTVREQFVKGEAKLLDIGSGAGFPGLVIKICCPEFSVTLVEPRQKRAAFLRHIARTLKLGDINIIEERIKHNDQQFTTKYGQFSLVTCRALTSIEDFLGMCCHLVAPEGKVLFLKGPKAHDEIKKLSTFPEGFELISSSSFNLPFSGANRTHVIFSRKAQI